MRINYMFRYLLHIAILGALFFLYKCIRDTKSSSENATKSYVEIKKSVHKQYDVDQNSREINNLTIATAPGLTGSNRPEANTMKKEKVKTEEETLKYILQWIYPRKRPFIDMGKGREAFIKKSCKYTNCYVTSDRNYLGDITKFDVIAFSGPDVAHMAKELLPTVRSPHQKYAFGSIESSEYYPMCDEIFNGFFNWTWTFRLDSDNRWGYIVIRNDKGEIIGPNTIMHWISKKDMKPISKDLEAKLKRKSIAAAWFVSNCDTKSRREKLVKKLEKQLKKYKLEIDIYGRCGSLVCDRKNEAKCDELIEEKYFFYLAFENSFNEDYVTEKVLHGLKHSAIPIVYGGANYSRFLPDGSYLNARTLTIEELAAKMHELIQDFTKYSEYFKWRNHYSFHRRIESPETDDYCGMCALLNDDKKVKEHSVYQNFKEWWNVPNFKC